MEDNLASGENQARVESAVPPVLTTAVCHKCSAIIAADANYCSRCGKKQRQGDAWYYHPVWILVLAFFVLGPFALLLVWKSQKMGTAFKLIMAAMILAYTWYCFYFTYRLVMFEVREFGQLNDVLHQIRQIQ